MNQTHASQAPASQARANQAGVAFEDIERAVAQHGLMCRGGFYPLADDGVPPLEDGKAAATLVLVGNAGAALWPCFQTSPEAADGLLDPMNRWTERIIGALSPALGAAAVFPFGGPPYHPFQRWARRAEPVAASPLGVLIHPQHGLWHAYRAALLFAEVIKLPPREEAPTPCDSCPDKPCMSACPVGAFGDTGYDVPACAGHLSAPQGAACLDDGCLARHACPVGKNALYPAGQAGFHMRAFLAARPKREGEP